MKRIVLALGVSLLLLMLLGGCATHRVEGELPNPWPKVDVRLPAPPMYGCKPSPAQPIWVGQSICI